MKWSTASRDFVGIYGSLKRAFQGGVLKIYSGTVPADADAAVTGSLLSTISLSSGAVTREVLSTGTATLSGSAGQVDSIAVGGMDVLKQVVPFNTSLTQTAADCVTAINKNMSYPDYKATSSGAIITISALPGTGTEPNTKTVLTTASGGITSVDVNMAGGVATVNGLTFGAVTAGKLVKSGVWSGVNSAGGVASHFRFESSVTDAGGSSTILIRAQGTIGTSGADYNMGNTTLESGATHTVDTFSITVPAT